MINIALGPHLANLGLGQLLQYMMQILMAMCGDQSGKFVCGWRVLMEVTKQTQGYMKGEFSRFMLFPCQAPCL